MSVGARWRGDRRGARPEARDPDSGPRQHVRTQVPLAEPVGREPEPDLGHTAAARRTVRRRESFHPNFRCVSSQI